MLSSHSSSTVACTRFWPCTQSVAVTHMFSSRAAFSKASRFPLTSKRGNKDYYKGTRAAALPGGHRTGAPGKHVVGGKAKYRLIDEKVRYYVAPSIEDIVNSPLKPYVHVSTIMPDKAALYGKLPQGGFNGEHYLKIAKAVSDGTTSFTEEPEVQKQ